MTLVRHRVEKDICDRRTAPLKIHTKRYDNEGNDITSAEEFKDSYGELWRNTRHFCLHC